MPERVWAETRKALGEPQPSRIPARAARGGALRVLFPEIDALYGVPQRAEFHPEIDTGVHVEMVLDAAAQLAPGDDIGWLLRADARSRQGADTQPTNCRATSATNIAALAPLRALCARLKVPSRTRGAGRAGVPRTLERTSRV